MKGKRYMPRKDRTVLHVIRSLHPDYGGPVEGIRQLIGPYRAKGWGIEVACLDDPSSPWLQSFPAVVHALGPSLGAFGFQPAAIMKLRHMASRYDAVVINGIWEFTGPMALLGLAGLHTPYYVFTHGMLDPWFKRQYPLKHLKKWLYWPFVGYWLLRNARGVFFTTQEERILARQSFWLYRCNEVVIGYGTSRPAGDPIAQTAAFRAAYLQTVGKRNLLYLSRIHRKKGCELLIEAYAKVIGDDPDWRLIMGGPDATGWRPELEAQAQRLGVADHIVWTGSLGGDLKWGAFHAADAFVLPSHQENFGIAVAEAMACSLPVLVSDKVNIWREIVQWKGGLVEPDTLAGTIALLERWKAMPPAETEAMRAAALDCFNANFDMQVSSGRMIDLLEAAAQEASG
jgi:glycosyltransferase involved in cell wall biosynthesis